MTQTQNKIPKGWKETTLGNISSLVKRGITPSYSDLGVYVINQKCIRNNRISYSEARYTDPNIKKIPNEKYLINNDILVCSTGVGTLGRVGQIKEVMDKTTVDSHVTIIRLSDYVNKSYIGYLLHCLEKTIEQMAEGTTGQTELPRIKLENFPILLPPLPEQKAIAGVLTSLDDKIELLREENRTLEEMAQVLFKRWFVEFEFPDDAGRPYRSAGGRMIKSELGEIPEGWRVIKIDELVNHIKDNVKPFESPEKIFIHYSIPAYDNSLNPELSLGKDILSNKYKVLNNSFLVSKLNPSTPRIWTLFSAEGNSICSTEFQVFQTKEKQDFSYMYSLFNSNNFTSDLSAKAHGTSSSHQRVKPSDITNIIFSYNNEVSREYQDIVISIIQKVDLNKIQIHNISKIRDALLPKLMTGEIRVNNLK